MAAQQFRRKRGTGSVHRDQYRWIATLPANGSRYGYGAVLGRYDTRREAERALDAWLAEQQQKELR